MNPVVEYDELVKNYLENLHTTLRKFSPGPDFLETWVHDENHTKSVLAIFESAADYGVEHLTLNVSKAVADHLDRSYLSIELGKLGKLQFAETPTAVAVTVDFGRKTQ